MNPIRAWNRLSETKKRRVRIAILVLAILAFIGGGLAWYKQFIMEDCGGKYKLLNPIIKYDEAKNIMTEKELPIGTIIEDYIDQRLKMGQSENISVYYRALNNGDWIGINEKEYFSPASLMKFPILIGYLKKSEAEKGFLDKKVTYIKDAEDPTYAQEFAPQEQIQEGHEYTFRQLLESMIKYSDNNASLLLEKSIEPERLANTFFDLGLTLPQPINGEFDNNIKVKDYATFFRVLFNSSYLNRDDSEWGLKLLGMAEFDSGIVAGLPANIQVVHKFGERGIVLMNGREQKQLHDCGIIYYPEHPYVLCLMTRGYDRGVLEGILKDISKIVYDGLNSVYKK